MSFNATTSFIAEDIGYPIDELTPSRTISTNFKATRRVKVNWSERYDWAYWFTDSVTKYGYFWAAGLASNAIVTGVRIEPDTESKLTHGTNDVSEAVYLFAYLTLTYHPSSLSGNTQMIQEITPKNEMLHPAGNWFFKFGDGTAAPFSPYHQAGFTLRTQYPRLFTVPNVVATLPGFVNSDYFVPRMFPAMYLAPGTLLYQTPIVKAAMHFNGTVRYDVTHVCDWRPHDWNMEPNWQSGNFEYVYDIDGKTVVKYPSTQFTGVV